MIHAPANTSVVSQKTDFAPGCPVAALKARARLNRTIRAFFDEREVMEVEVPLLARHFVTDPFLEPVTADNAGQRLYLQSSPEYALKRLLAQFECSVYALGKAFRAGECGSRHNPEFTLLEWYRPGWDDRQLMREVAELVTRVMPALPVTYLSYRDWFERELGVNPHTATLAELESIASRYINIEPQGLRRDDWLDLLITHELEPRLPAGLVFVYDYPASQAALARIEPDAADQPVARRFEAFFDGMELANGYWELTDPAEQRRRFERDRQTRRDMGAPDYAIDEYLMAALESGLPECAGVALGVDRLLMRLLGEDRIERVLAFDAGRV